MIVRWFHDSMNIGFIIIFEDSFHTFDTVSHRFLWNPKYFLLHNNIFNQLNQSKIIATTFGKTNNQVLKTTQFYSFKWNAANDAKLDEHKT